ncbi:hypothetical protein ACFLTP_06285 [Chloroflexota bacterium]
MITSVQWHNSAGHGPIETTMDGTPLKLFVKATGHDGKTVNASIRRVDSLDNYNYVATVPILISSGSGIGNWTARWQQEDVGSNSTYVFGVEGIYSAKLTVNQRYTPHPDVTINNVAMIAYINVGQVRTDTVTIQNNDDKLVVVRLIGYSSVEGEFYNQAVSLPEASYTSMEIHSSFGTPELRTITYKLYYEDTEFNSWSGLLEVL